MYSVSETRLQSQKKVIVQRRKMQTKTRQITMLCLMSIILFLMAGCGFKKEVVLEHSDYTAGSEAEGMTADEELEQDPGMEADSETAENSTQSADAEAIAKEQIYVYICGQVKEPGVYQIPSDARIFAVIELAGGLTEEADEAGVNQAQTLTDGQMIYIPAVGETVIDLGNGTSQSGQTDSSKININTADLEALMSLPGIGEGKAQSILDYRQEHGDFKSIEEIMNVDGIKEGTYTKFKDKITI